MGEWEGGVEQGELHGAVEVMRKVVSGVLKKKGNKMQREENGGREGEGREGQEG